MKLFTTCYSLMLSFGILAPALANEPATKMEGPATSGQAWAEVKRFAAPEAKQGVAVDACHFYSVDNRQIGKYDKITGKRVAHWQFEGSDDIVHFNAGVVHEGRLYLAHSNFPKFPPASSIEIFDVATLKPVATHSFGLAEGSLTWVDFYMGKRYACFVNYDQPVFREIGRNPQWSQVIEYDDQWRRLRAWTFPEALIESFHGYGASGGNFGPDGRLYVTGHDAREVYVLEFPDMGSRLRWVDTLPVATAGQAIVHDRSVKTPTLYSIERKTREVVVSERKP